MRRFNTIKSGVESRLVDTALTRVEIKNCKQLKFNYLQFYGVPRTEPLLLYSITIMHCVNIVDT